jgi:hypothetical protein
MGAQDAVERPTRGERIGVVVIHGVGDTQTGWINERIVEPLAGRQPDLELGPYSEVYGLAEPSAEEKQRFNALIRRARIEGQEIALAELLWADLSRVGRSAISQAIATVKLAFEAPDVLALALMRGRERGVFRLIKWLVLTSSRLLLWFIVGLNICVLAGSAWMMGAIQVRDALRIEKTTFNHTDIIYWLGPLIIFLLVTGAIVHRRYHNRELGLAEFGRGLFLSTFLIAAFLAVDHVWPKPLLETLHGLSGGKWQENAYIDNGRLIIFAAWFLWCVSTLAVFMLLVGIWAKRQIRAPAEAIPLAPGWIALFHILIQAVIVKLIFAPLSMASCMQMRALAGDSAAYSALAGICSPVEMSGVFFLALIETIVIVIAVLLVWRARKRGASHSPLDPGRVPRLIVNRWIVAAAAVSVTAHISVFFLDMWIGGVYAKLLPGPVMVALSLAMPLYLFLMSYFYSSSSGLVHIARDLVDHQLRVEPKKAGSPEAGSMRQLANKWFSWRRDLQLSEFPRRHRIAARLDCIMGNCFAPEGLDKLVIIAHSQGSVIAFDYLRASTPSELLSNVGEVHVITLGSPLSHLYAAYFQEYERPVARAELRGKVMSWTNMWRIDDPIGNKVQVVAGDFIRNVVLPKGGHVNYWKEPEVQQAILDAVRAPSAASDRASTGIEPPRTSAKPLPPLPVAHRPIMD